MISPTGFLVLEALERAIIDTDVAIRPHQVMGWPVSLDGNHWLMKRIEIKELDNAATLGNVSLKKGKTYVMIRGRNIILKILLML